MIEEHISYPYCFYGIVDFDPAVDPVKDDSGSYPITTISGKSASLKEGVDCVLNSVNGVVYIIKNGKWTLAVSSMFVAKDMLMKSVKSFYDELSNMNDYDTTVDELKSCLGKFISEIQNIEGRL